MSFKKEVRIAKVDSVSGSVFMELIKTIDHKKMVKDLDFADKLADAVANPKYEMNLQSINDYFLYIGRMACDYLKQRGLK
jgi:hypothetical protein